MIGKTAGDIIMTENINNSEMSVGEILRNARTTGRRKRELQTIAKQLCIREEFLQALEDGNYKVIPETVYILGFARNYAMELGLEPDEIVAKIKREMGIAPECDDDDGKKEPGCELPDNTNNTNNANHKFIDGVKKSMKYVRRHWIWFTAGAVVLIALVGGAMLAGAPSGEVTSETPVVIDIAETATNDADVEYTVAVRERFGTENSENADVILQATQDSWVEIKDRGGDTIFGRVLVPGDVYYVPSGNGYSATFGNAGGIDVWVNGKLAPKQGDEHVRKSGISLNPSDLVSE